MTELKHAGNPIDSTIEEEQIVSNLFHGWGYNFYRAENQVRADDLLVRNKVSDLLGQARSHLARLEAEYRRGHLPAPTREHPFPDAQAVAAARALGQAQRDIESVEVAIRSAPVPEMDRITQRHRNELDTLQRLRDIDLQLVSGAVNLQRAIAALDDGATAAQAATQLLQGSTLHTIGEQREQALSSLGA